MFDRISSADRPLSEDVVRFYGAEMVLGLEALHKANYAYRDMKLENVLFDKDGMWSGSDHGFLMVLGVRPVLRGWVSLRLLLCNCYIGLCDSMTRPNCADLFRSVFSVFARC